MMLHTGQFNDSFMPITDGVATTVKNYAYWLNKKYDKSIVITPDYPGYHDHETFEVLRYKSIKLPSRAPYRLGLPGLDWDFKSTIRNYEFDILHAHSPFSSGKIALKLARERNIPIVATFHSKFYDDFKTSTHSDLVAKMMTKKVVQFFNQVDHVYTVNSSTVETLHSYGFKGRVDILENGTDFESAIEKSQLADYRDYVNRTHQLNDNMKVLLFVGQHIWLKNVRLIIESMALLKQKYVEFKMIFIGEGIHKDGMLKLVTSLNILNDVIFVDKITERDVLKRYYARADLFLFPSEYDTVGLVVKEAAAFKCPSLVLRNTNAAEIIKDNVNGYLSDNDKEAFAHKIISILNDQKLNVVGQNAQDTLVRSYENIVDELYLRYRDIIEMRKHY